MPGAAHKTTVNGDTTVRPQLIHTNLPWLTPSYETGMWACLRRILASNGMLAIMTKAGGASLASGALSALATKVLAVFAGPGSVALWATLQQSRQIAVLVATGNGQTALVQGASALSGTPRREYLRTLACLFAGLTLLVVAGLLGSGLGLLGSGIWPKDPKGAGLSAHALIGLSVPVTLSSGFVFLSALLTALGGVGRLALVQVVAGLATLATALFLVGMRNGGSGPWPAGALLLMMGLSALASLLAVIFALQSYRQTLEEWFCGAGRIWSNHAALHFSSIAASLAISGLLSSAVLLFVRGRITSSQGLAVTGQWDAAWNISMNQAALVLASMQTSYLPAVARIAAAPEKARQVSNTLAAGSLTAAVVIAGMALTKPWLLQILYAEAFRPGAAFLRWTLLGDYLKVGSWILSIPILAAGDMKMFFAADLAAYATLALGSVLLTLPLGAATAASVAFVLMYAVHLILCGAALRFRYRMILDRRAALSWLGGLGLVGAVSLLSWNLR